MGNQITPGQYTQSTMQLLLQTVDCLFRQHGGYSVQIDGETMDIDTDHATASRNSLL
jgi:hypothetical protein